jgi:hypothetical protein
MDTLRNESMIKLARDTIDLVILRLQVEAKSNKRVNREDYFRLSCARELLAECNATGRATGRQHRDTVRAKNRPLLSIFTCEISATGQG